jgi:hypothetical protein
VSERTVKRVLHKDKIYRRAVWKHCKHMFVKELNWKKHLAWC